VKKNCFMVLDAVIMNAKIKVCIYQLEILDKFDFK